MYSRFRMTWSRPLLSWPFNNMTHSEDTRDAAAGFTSQRPLTFQEQLESIGRSPHQSMAELDKIEEFLDLVDGALMDNPCELGKVILDFRSALKYFYVNNTYLHPHTKLPCDPPTFLPELKEKITQYVEEKKLEHQIELKIKTRETRLENIKKEREQLHQRLDHYFEEEQQNDEQVRSMMQELYRLDQEETGLRGGVAYTNSTEYLQKKIHDLMFLQDHQLASKESEAELAALLAEIEIRQQKSRQFISRYGVLFAPINPLKRKYVSDEVAANTEEMERPKKK
jgi:hypothetical protein